MKYLPIILTTLCLLIGCASEPLPVEWRPITTLIERPDLPSVSGTTVTTISPYLITSDIDEFWENHPKGSDRLEGLRRHEVTHAKEQESYPGGKALWLQRYVAHKSFRWEVEKAGWKEEILYLRSRGHSIHVDNVAKALSGKGYHDMVSFEEAKQWVLDVLAGRA